MRSCVLRVMTCGSVDDGKSTLIGRLLYDGHMLPSDLRDAIGPAADGVVDYALLLDGLEAERAQQITIDVAWRYVASPRRRFIIADAPGHAQYLRNMATAAAYCEVAVLLVDAARGVLPQTRRHAAMLVLLGVREVILAVNKMDLVGYDEARFRHISEDFAADLAVFGQTRILAIPVSARCGDNVVTGSAAMPWYDGPDLLTALESAGDHRDIQADQPGRMPIDWVDSAVSGHRRYAGSVACGSLRVGDAVLILPANSRGVIASLSTFDGKLDVASDGMAVMLSLTEPVDAGPGDVICTQTPVMATTGFAARLVWLADSRPGIGADMRIKIGTRMSSCRLTQLVSTLDLDSGAWGDVTDANLVGGSGIIRVIIGLRERTALTTRDECRDLGQFLLIDRTTNAILAFGVVDHIEPPRPDVVWQFTAIDRAARVALKPQTPCLIWLTGLPAAGKSTIADRLEVMLHGRGVHTMALDGDNLRHGLCRDLGFSAEDRVENIRRAGETARLMLDAGLIVIASFVSPYRADRDMVRALCPPGMFIEVFVNTPLSLCQLRDPKGLYRRAKAGVLHGLTGVDAPYEPPLNPEIELSTADVDPDLLALEIIEMLRVKGCLPG